MEASVTVAVGVIQCPLPATMEDAISAAHKMQPGEPFEKHSTSYNGVVASSVLIVSRIGPSFIGVCG